MSRERQKLWLRVGGAALTGFGIMIALAAFPVVSAPTLLLADILVWPLDGAQSGKAPETRLLAAIGGGVMVGWGILLWSLAGSAFDRMQDLVPLLVRRSALGWFVVDSIASVAAGVPLNVLSNIALLALLFLPFRVPRAVPV